MAKYVTAAARDRRSASPEATRWSRPQSGRFDPNLQKVRIQENGRPLRAYVCTRCLKSNKVTKAA